MKKIKLNHFFGNKIVVLLGSILSCGLAMFKVEHSTIESGINEVVTYLEKNDSALVILPHHIAHGRTSLVLLVIFPYY
ncbi:hypothetical protein N9K77_01505 [bacterium]|nr:hypothetical protein [bacterium]